jgi:hypothetical protein
LPFEVDGIPPLTERAVFAVRSFAADRFPDRLADPLLAFFFIVYLSRNVCVRAEGHQLRIERLRRHRQR